MPSLINDLAIAEIRGIVDAHSSLMLIDPAGLKADESLNLRRELFGVGAQMKVAKARLVKHAVGDEVGSRIDGRGSLAIVCGEDIASAAKIIRDLAKNDKVAVRAGLAEGTPLDSAGAMRLADLPSKHEARVMVVKAIRAPYLRLAKILKAPYRKLGRAVAARKEKLEEA